MLNITLIYDETLLIKFYKKVVKQIITYNTLISVINKSNNNQYLFISKIKLSLINSNH